MKEKVFIDNMDVCEVAPTVEANRSDVIQTRWVIAHRGSGGRRDQYSYFSETPHLGDCRRSAVSVNARRMYFERDEAHVRGVAGLCPADVRVTLESNAMHCARPRQLQGQRDNRTGQPSHFFCKLTLQLSRERTGKT